MKYRVLNSDFEPIPRRPFDTLDDAVRHIRAIQEIYANEFHVLELNIVKTVPANRTDK